MAKTATIVPVVLLAAILMCSSRGAEPIPVDANTPTMLPEYLRHAALNNPGLKAAFEAWKGAMEQVPQAKALPDPTFTYNYFTEQIDTRWQAGIMQMFPWFGTIDARTDAAAAAALAAQKRLDAKRLQLFLDVKDAFYEYLYLRNAVRIARENLDLAQHFEEVARARYVAAAASHPDIVRAQIRVAELQNDLVSLEQLREPTVARLNAVLNRPAGSPLPWPQQEPLQPVELDRSMLVASLKKNNPQLQALDLDIERLAREVDLARKRFYPDIGVGVERMEMAMGEEDMRLGVELNLPIWQRSYKAGELQARAMARRAQSEKKDTENDLILRTAKALYEFEDSGRRVKLYGSVLVPKAEELIGASETAYMAGNVDFLSLVDAQQTLLEYRLQYERASANRQQRLAELEMLVGADLPRAGMDQQAQE